MVGRGEADASLQEETAEECSGFGTVVRVAIDEARDLMVPDEEAVRIFVLFETIPYANAAIQALNGRFFAGRSVKASFYDEARFLDGSYRDTIINVA